MDSKEIIEAKILLEQEIYKTLNNFELKSGLMIESIKLIRRHIDAGIGLRDALDKIIIRASLPE